MASNKSPRFKKVYIEITNVCNLSCPFCPGTVREPVYMSAADFERVLRNLEGYTRYIYLHVMGEPLLHPDLPKLLDISYSYGFRVNITTNGTLISERQKDLLDANALRQVNFSIHSQENVAGLSMHTPGNISPGNVNDLQALDKYTNGIFGFTCKALARGDVFVSYRLWNIGSPSAEQFNKHILGSIEKYFGLDFSLQDAFIDKNRITIKDRLYLNKAEVFEWPDDTHAENDTKASPESDPDGCIKSAGNGFCLGLRDQLAVLADGTVVPCCLDNNGTISLGNILTHELEHILKSERADAFYRGFSQRRAVERLCRSCSYRRRFS